MKRFFIFACLLLSAVMTFAQTKKVAILEVVDREGRINYSQKMMLRSNLARAVANTTGYEAYDRTDVDAIMNEHDFQRTGLVSDAEIRKLGEMTGVSLILVTEGVLTGDGKIFVSAKILNVETAKVEIIDNMTMGMDASSMQQGCTQLAKRLFGVTATNSAMEKYNIERMGPNSYIYISKYMEKKEYEYFLRNNCPKAYGEYKRGKQIIGAGWGVMGAGAAIIGAGAALVAVGGEDGEVGGFAMLGLGGSIVVAGGSILLPIGYIKRNNAYKIYNNTCASSSAAPIAFNLTTGKNGLGIAMNF